MGQLPVRRSSVNRHTSNVGLIPHFPVPRVHLIRTIPFHGMLGPFVYQLSPFLIVRRHMSPTSINAVGSSSRVKLEEVGVWTGRKSQGHEPNLDIGLDTPSEISIEYSIDDGEIVRWTPIGIFGVGVRAAPFQAWDADQVSIAGGQEVVCAKVGLGRAKSSKLLDEFLAVRVVCEVWLIAAEESMNRNPWAQGSRRVHQDCDLASSRRSSQQKNKQSYICR